MVRIEFDEIGSIEPFSGSVLTNAVAIAGGFVHQLEPRHRRVHRWVRLEPIQHLGPCVRDVGKILLQRCIGLCIRQGAVAGRIGIAEPLHIAGRVNGKDREALVRSRDQKPLVLLVKIAVCVEGMFIERQSQCGGYRKRFGKLGCELFRISVHPHREGLMIPVPQVMLGIGGDVGVIERFAGRCVDDDLLVSRDLILGHHLQIHDIQCRSIRSQIWHDPSRQV